MNDHTLPVRQENPSTLGFGISPLHAWIRCMECILHIAYRNDVKKWAIRSVEDKKKVEERKRKIQKEFRKEIGLRIDTPRKTSGNSNDGNTARRFFRDASASARITGIDETLIHSFGVILEALSCGYSISKVAFGEYAKRTRERYLELYPWFFMPVTVHKILVHGVSIIESCVLPIGQLSEEAQEARNKENRDFREYYSRKNSRQNANIDLLHRLLISSDPYIPSLSKPRSPKSHCISSEALGLLCEPNL